MSTKAMRNTSPDYRPKHSYMKKLRLDIMRNIWLYILLIPGVIYFIVFAHIVELGF